MKREPSVTKGACERYTIQSGYDFATICISEWAPRQDAHGPIYGGEILVNSTFGPFCASWGHCGVPFKRFLAGLNFDYFMEKTRGRETRLRFDGERSVRDVFARLIELRREGLSREKARDAWDVLVLRQEEAGSSPNEFVSVVHSLELRGLSEPWELIREEYTPDTRGFWSDIWPLFVATLSAENGEGAAR